MDVLNSVIQQLGKSLHSVAGVVSLGKKLAPEKAWYLSPEQHVIEILISNALFGSLLFVTLRRKNASAKSTTNSQNIQSSSSSVNNVPKDDIQRLGIVPKILRSVLTVCFIITIIHKYNGNKLALMLMPCHTVTLCFLYSLYAKKHSTAEFVFNVAVHYMFFTWLAILLPDHTDLNQFFEIPNFWIHHWVLVLIPIYMIATYHYKIDHSNHYHFKLAAACGGLLHFNAMSLAGILSGNNVGYMLYPPPKTPFTGPYFRWGHASLLVFLGWFSGYIVPWALVRVREQINYLFKMKKND